jgi:hypothetical protein
MLCGSSDDFNPTYIITIAARDVTVTPNLAKGIRRIERQRLTVSVSVSGLIH